MAYLDYPARTALYVLGKTGYLMYNANGAPLIGTMLMAFAFFLAREINALDQRSNLKNRS